MLGSYRSGQGVHEQQLENVEYEVDKENCGEALNIQIAGRSIFGAARSPREAEVKKNSGKPPMPGR